MITTIIFDLSEVLLQGLLGIENLLYQKYDLKIDNTMWKIEEMELFFHGKISEEDYWSSIIKTYKWEINVNQLKETVRQNFKEIEGTRKLIEQLKNNGYKLGLLSVHAKEWITYCEEKYKYHCLFDSITYSYEVAVSKPDKKAYKHILKKLDAAPRESLFIDDSQSNVNTAIELGLTGIQFKNSEQLKEELINLGIKVI